MMMNNFLSVDINPPFTIDLEIGSFERFADLDTGDMKHGPSRFKVLFP